jgi:hypothetical protein
MLGLNHLSCGRQAGLTPLATPRLILNAFSRSSAILTTREDKTAVPLCETDSYEILYKVRNEILLRDLSYSKTEV